MAMAARVEHYRTHPELPYAPYITSTAVPKPQPRQLPEEQQRRRPAQKTRARQRSAISLFNLVGVCTAAFLLVLVISGYVQLFEATSEVADLTNQLSAAQEVQATLVSQYEGKIDLKYVEEIATTELGMMQPLASQVVHLDLCEPDHAEVIQAEKAQKPTTVFSALRSSILGMLGYFRAYFA